MPARVRLAVLVAVACVVAVAAVAVVLVPGHADQRPAGFVGSLAPPQLPPRDFHLTDQDGRPASLSQYRGRVVILTFLYSHCRDTCPLTAQQIRGALDDVGGSSVPALAVSVDPAHDTRASAHQFVADQHMTGRLRFLLGSSSKLAPVWRAYGIQPEGQGYEHSAYVLLIDRRGRQRVGFPTDQLTPEGLAHDVRRLLAEPA